MYGVPAVDKSAWPGKMSSQPPSKTPNPALVDLAQPEKLSQVLKDDQYDCLACRLTGTALTMNISQSSHSPYT